MSPLLSGESILLAEPHGKKELLALKRESLQVMWRLPGKALRPLVVVSDEHVVVRNDRWELGVVDLRKGDLVWSKHAYGLPPIWRGIVVSQMGKDLELLDVRSGNSCARVELPAGDGGPDGVCGDITLVSRADGGAIGVDLSSGQVLWQRNLIKDIRAKYGFDYERPVISYRVGTLGDRFIVRRDTVTCACSAATGELLWFSPLCPGDVGPDVRNGRIYGMMPDRFIALDEATGEVVYDVHHPELQGALFPKRGAFFGDFVAYSMESGHLAVFDIRDGRLAAHYKYKEPLTDVVEADGRLLVGAGDGNLLVFDVSGIV